MKNLAERIIRIATLPPIVTGLTVLLLYFFAADKMPTADFIVSEICLLLIPVLSYPIREIFRIGKERREGQRNTALVFSAIGYTIGFIWAMAADSSMLTKVFFSSYLFSVIVLLIINKAVKFKASGHACSTTAPTVFLVWQLNAWFIIPCAALIAAVYQSSLKLKRHTLPQLIAGSAISVVASVFSILTFT